VAHLNFKTVSTLAGLVLCLYGLMGIHSFGIKKAHFISSICGNSRPSDLAPYLGTCHDYCLIALTGLLVLMITRIPNSVIQPLSVRP